MDETALIEKRSIFESEALPYLDEIYASSMRLARNVQGAEDLSATTFEQAWKSFEQFQSGTNLRAWLYKIMTNSFINEYRKRQRTPETVSLDELEDPDDFYIFNRVSHDAPGGADSSDVVRQFEKEDINRAIDKLPDEYRVTIVLGDIQGFSYEEISDMTEVPIGTVRSRLSRGRKLLQKYLWDYSGKAGVSQ